MQIIQVTVKPGSSRDLVEEGESGLTVWLRAKAIDGKANESLIDLIAKHYRTKRRFVEIRRGHHSRVKLVAIGGPEGT